MKKLSKEEKEEKKQIKKQAKEKKKESKKIKQEEKEIVKEVEKKDKKSKLLNKNTLIIAVIALLAICLLLSSVSSILLAKKLNRLERRYNALSDTNETIMKIISTDDGTGDRINNISDDIETLKNDLNTVRESSTELANKVNEQDSSITNVNKKLSSIDENRLKGLYTMYDWNKSLSIKQQGSLNIYSPSNRMLSGNSWGSNSSTYYAYCLTSALKGEVPDNCK